MPTASKLADAQRQLYEKHGRYERHDQRKFSTWLLNSKEFSSIYLIYNNTCG